MSDPVVQWQIVAKDPEAVTAFYAGLFGWKVTTANALGYREIETGGTPGGVWPSPPNGHNLVQLFVAVEDVERSVAEALRLGAKVLIPPTALPDGDTMAILADPAGLSFGVMLKR